MAAPSEKAKAVHERFLQQNYSDCLLLSLRTEKSELAKGDRLYIELKLVAGEHADQWVPATLTFSTLAFARIDVDFWAKVFCGDAIDEATCEYGEEEAERFLEEHPFRRGKQDLSDFLLFTIKLCEPSGTLAIFAKDFALVISE
jgi:hypothetical protein